MLASVSLRAQNIRTNYRSGGMTHISTDYELLQLGNVPAWTRLELVGFPDGSSLYLLYINLEQNKSTNVPKGVKMAVNLSGGSFVRLEQIGEDSATKRRQQNGLYLNRTKYAVEPADLERILHGVRSVDIVTGWEPEDYVQGNFSSDEFSSMLRRQRDAIVAASDATIDLDIRLAAYTDNLNSTMATSSPVVGHGEHFIYNIILTHIYYKATNTEDIDLSFMIGTEDSYHIPFDSAVRFTLRDGSVIDLQQTRDETNFVYVFPSMEQLYQICSKGIASLSVTHENGVLVDTFTEGQEGFSEAVNQQVQLLLSISPR